jgi:ABC-type transport system involved in cytochrome c biogenesis permease subunit
MLEVITLILILSAGALEFAGLVRGRRISVLATAADLAALLLLVAGLVSISLNVGFPLIASFRGAMLAFCLALLAVAAFKTLADARPWAMGLTTVIRLVAALFFLPLLLPGLPPVPTELNPLLKSYWLLIHISAAIGGEAFFTASAATALFWFFFPAERKEIEKSARLFALIGFALYGAGALVCGMIWASEAWGTAWSWDPKETWALVTWIGYAIFLHARGSHKIPDTVKMIILLLAFGVAMFSFVGVNLLLHGLHGY